MKISGASRMLCLLALSGCAPEVIDLAMFGLDAGGSASLDAGSMVRSELDAEPPAAFDAASDTGRTQAELDARARADADRVGGSCMSKDDCAAGHVCDLVGCGASMKGTCVLAEDCSDERFEPVCDCNGFKHLNDCERRRQGAAKDRECLIPRPPCTGKGSACPPTPEGLTTYCGSYSQRSSNGLCTRAERACFVLPECPGFGVVTSMRHAYSACNPDVSGATIAMGLEICMSACDQIKVGDQFAPALSGRCINLWPRTGGGGAGGPGFPTGGF